MGGIQEGPGDRDVTMPGGRIRYRGSESRAFDAWQKKNPYFGKHFSVLGDSISTLEGFHPRGNAVFYDGACREKSGVWEMGDTWWGKVIEFFGGQLLVNDSWSGCRVTRREGSADPFPSGCSEKRTGRLHVGEVQPDVILIYMGINDWGSGGTYPGEVVSIGDFPTDDDNWNGMGNPTASSYPFRAFVGEEADLQAGSYVSMSYSTASAERGIYLEKAFVRTDKDGSYIFVRGADGKLEKRSVRVGKVLWGSYYEILSSLGEEDFLAFPYGKNVKQGAPTVESDLSTLYTF